MGAGKRQWPTRLANIHWYHMSLNVCGTKQMFVSFAVQELFANILRILALVWRWVPPLQLYCCFPDVAIDLILSCYTGTCTWGFMGSRDLCHMIIIYAHVLHHKSFSMQLWYDMLYLCIEDNNTKCRTCLWIFRIDVVISWKCSANIYTTSSFICAVNIVNDWHSVAVV